MIRGWVEDGYVDFGDRWITVSTEPMLSLAFNVDFKTRWYRGSQCLTQF